MSMTSTAHAKGRTTAPAAAGRTVAPVEVVEARRRRSFAVISHPDAGKSTLTEALALHARVLTHAGAVNGKDGRGGTVSDWMDIER
ncbi:MAG: GTP-binding protein, partial [Dermatophilaceae bacterium]